MLLLLPFGARDLKSSQDLPSQHNLGFCVLQNESASSITQERALSKQPFPSFTRADKKLCPLLKEISPLLPPLSLS